MTSSDHAQPAALAIVGMGCLFPKAPHLGAYWANIKGGVDAITEIPESHWRPEDYYDADPARPDFTYGKRGSFLSPIPFDTMGYGIQPKALEATDTAQLLGMVAARHALEDAGYGQDRDFDRDRVSVVLGVTSALELLVPLGARLGHPKWRRALRDAGADEALIEDALVRMGESYVPWQENSFPGLLGNVVAGRVSKYLNLGGANCVCDAACASSLSAIYLAAMELETGRADMAVTGGVDTFNDIFMYMCFSKTPALSPTGDARPFAVDADGTILGEGLGVFVLKRLADAERDGDQVYAVIRGMGASSDGKGEAIYAPSPSGQMKALRRAYEAAGVSPDTIELIEAHGTGTKAGDAAEVKSLTGVFGASSARPWCALGSVKSQIGHTKACAGAAGLMKTALALHHKVIPPTIKVAQPAEAFLLPDTPFYVNTVKRPWLPCGAHPRRAGVSAFGFGGSNFHCLLEEYGSEKHHPDWDGDIEIVALCADGRAEIRSAVQALPESGDWEMLCEVAAASRASFRSDAACRLVLVLHQSATDIGALKAKLIEMLERGGEAWQIPRSACFSARALSGEAAFVFPGQGAQYIGMLRDIVCQFPEALAALATADRTVPEAMLAERIYPQPAFDDMARREQDAALRATDVAQPALGAVGVAALRVLRRFAVRASAAAGHSYGELVALHAAGRFSEEELYRLSRVRGALMAGDGGDRGGMLAVRATLSEVEEVLRDEGLDLVVANKNAPDQAVLSGARDEIARAAAAFKSHGVKCVALDVAAAFHSTWVAEAEAPFRKALEAVPFTAGTLRVLANKTGETYPEDAAAARDLLASQLANPVDFVGEIENLYAAGIRTFIEVGPGARMSGLIKSILGERPHLTVAVDASAGKKPGILDLANLLAALAAEGHSVDLVPWNTPRVPDRCALEARNAKMTVPICGANYVSPRQPRPAAPNRPAVKPVEAAPPKEVVRSGDGNGRRNLPQSMDVSAVTAALRTSQQNMVALQQLQEQTAALHRQFLEGQQEAVQALQRLLDQQQALFGQGTLTPPLSLGERGKALPTPGREAESADTCCARVSDPAHAPTEGLPHPTPLPGGEGVAARTDTISTTLLETVSEKTGYPVEMLELDMALDADLGIDSIKRVEIFSTLQERMPELPPMGPQELGTLQTLRQVVDFMAQGNGSAVSLENRLHPIPLPGGEGVAARSTTVATTLLETVSEKTGYPVEMLELDMALDADLGIDSIKRVEIFSTLQERMPELPPMGPQELGTLQTLRQVVDFMAGTTGAVPEEDNAANQAELRLPEQSTKSTGYTHSTAPVSDSATPQHSRLQRLVLETSPLASKIESGPSSGPVWIVGDQTLGLSLRSAYEHLGIQAEWRPLPLEADVPDCLATLVVVAPSRTDDAFLANALDAVQRCGPALRKQGGALLSVSRMDGRFGLAGHPDMDSCSGGLAGLTKTASHEWENVFCRAIDFAPDCETIETLVAALHRSDTASEIGIDTTGQTCLVLKESPLAETDAKPFAPGDVVVISGGARGVTAAVAEALAKSCQPVLVLLGRSPLPDSEAPWLNGLVEESAIKRTLMENAATKLAPRDLQCAYERVVADREIRRTLANIEAAGGKARYRSVDVRDVAAVNRVLDTVRTEHGPIRGLIHGAGVLADRRIEDKTREQFDLVYGTKVGGLRALLDATQQDPLNHLVLFSSSTARFGRAGQVDYAMANEVLNKMAQCEAARRKDCRVVSVNWGPWAGGMVTPALAKVFEAEGIGLIDLEAGARYLLLEMCLPPGSPVEVVVLGVSNEAEELAEPQKLAPAFHIDLNIEDFAFLESHVINGKAVLPAAVTMEWLVQGALHAHPGMRFLGVDDLRIAKGVMLDAGETRPLSCQVGKAEIQGSAHAIPVELRGLGDGGKETLHASAFVLLSPQTPDPEQPGIMPPDMPLEDGAPRYGDGSLFHGPIFQGLRAISACDGDSFVAESKAATTPSTWYARPMRGAWTADPLAVDVAFQAMIVWCIEQYGVPSLPSRFDSYRQFRRFPKQGTRLVFHVTRHSKRKAAADIEFLDPADGALVARIHGYECTLLASLRDAFAKNTLARETAR